MSRLPRLIVAGTPKGDVQATKNTIQTVDGWQRPIVTPLLVDGLRDLLALANDENHCGAHILAYQPPSRRLLSDREAVERAIRHRHRIVWIDFTIRHCGADEYNERIQQLIAFEDAWRVLIRPTEQSPLMLPAFSFTAADGVSNLWSLAQRVSLRESSLDEVLGVIDLFRSIHHPGQCWSDTRNLEFRRAKHTEEHGRPPIDRRWKFTFPLRDGLHFDVTHKRDHDFSVSHPGKGRLPPRRHFNIDCHGHVRGEDDAVGPPKPSRKRP